MLHEYRDIISHMKENEAANAHFLKIFDRHNEIDNTLVNVEKGNLPLSDMEIEKLKKEKLLLKDEAYHIIFDYKKEHGI